MFTKTNSWKILLIVCLLPLLFINVKNSHDWGDDFSQYIIQAKNIIENRPQTENGLVIFPGKPLYAIEAYPVGFPCMIAPVYYLYGLQISPYLIFISVCLVVTGFICFEYFSRHENAISAFLICMLLCYNPTVLDLKKQILSEIPFTGLIMLSLLWPLCKGYQKKYSWLITALIFGLIISVRVIGVAVLAAYFFAEANRLLRKRQGKTWSNLFLTTSGSIAIFFILNTCIFSIHAYSLFGFYKDAMLNNTIHSKINFDYYYNVLRNFFPFWSVSISAIWLLTAFTGWFIRFIKFRTLSEYFFPLYLIVLVFYPYSSGGYRLLIPVFPLLVFYLYYFLSWLLYWFGKRQHQVVPVMLSLFFLAYIPNIISILKSQRQVENGPQEFTAAGMLNFVKQLPADDCVLFSRARAMHLYTGHLSLYPLVNQDPEDVLNEIEKVKSIVAVASRRTESQVYDKRMNDFISANAGRFKRIYYNAEFDVFRFE